MSAGDPPADVLPEFGSGGLSAGSAQLIAAAFRGDADAVTNAIIGGADVNAIDPATGLAALHIAAGSNDLFLCQRLIEDWSAAFFPDRFGRWPSLVAIECRAGDAVCEYIIAREALFITQTGPRTIEPSRH